VIMYHHYHFISHVNTLNIILNQIYNELIFLTCIYIMYFNICINYYACEICNIAQKFVEESSVLIDFKF